MRVARIITSTPDQVSALVSRLRAHGYEVETVPPGETPESPADLEVTVRSGKVSAILKEIVERVTREGDVYIAAGALHTEPPFPAASTEPPSIADTMNGVAAGLQNKRDLLAKALRDQRAVLRAARIAERQRARHTAVSGQIGVVHAINRPNIELPVNIPAVASGENGHGMVSPAVDGSVLPEANVAQGTFTPECGPPQQPRSQELVESATTQQSRQISSSRVNESLPTTSHHPRPRGIRVVIPGGRRVSQRAREWRAAVLISSLFAGLLMLGWAAVTRQPASPLPRNITVQTGVEESVPFGPATLKPAAASTSRAKPQLPPIRHAPEASPRRHVPESQTRAVAEKKFSRTGVRKQRRVRSNPEDDIAEDQVIIHRLSPAPRAVESEKASLKKFSD